MISQFLSNLIEQASMRLALAGDAGGVVDVPARENFIYGRIGGVGGMVAEIRVGVVRPNANDAIYIIRETPNQPGNWRMSFWLRSGSDPATPAPVIGSVYVLTGLVDDDSETLVDDDSEELQS